MYERRNLIKYILVLTLVSVFFIASVGFTKPRPEKPTSAIYQVTITNLTSQGQPFTPPLIVTHRRPVHVFQAGEAASFELKEIAENGNLDPMVMALSGEKHVSDLVVAIPGDPPPLMPGQSVTADLKSMRGAKYLSFAAMLICTNDGFTGLDSLPLPRKLGDTKTVYSVGYDAGTEINTEDFADLVPPCPALSGVPSDEPGTGTSNPALMEGGVIQVHANIQGIADLRPAIHGWVDPVAKIVVTRIK